jgi:hypothetical protein
VARNQCHLTLSPKWGIIVLDVYMFCLCEFFASVSLLT